MIFGFIFCQGMAQWFTRLGGWWGFFFVPLCFCFNKWFISQLLLTRSNFRLGILKCFFLLQVSENGQIGILHCKLRCVDAV